MTELIGVNEIPCLSDTDYAAYALYMQCLAEQVEERLVANQAAAEAALHRPVRAWLETAALPDGSSSQVETGNGIAFSLNYPATFSDNTLATLNIRGWWRIGMLLHAVSNNPALVGQNRVLTLAAFPPNTPSPLRNMDDGAWAVRTQDITWETNTGNGQSLYTQFEVYNPGDPSVGPNEPGMRIAHALAVETSAGAETVTFTGKTWAIYLGDTPSIDI